jgi:hypothetical protein
MEKEKKPESKAVASVGTNQSVLRLTDRVIVTGMTGTGKTYFVKWYIKTALLKKIKVFVWDPLHQYADLGVPHGSLQSISNEELRDLDKAIVYQPDPISDNEFTFDAVCKWILARQNMYFVAEEFAYYTSASYSPKHFEALAKRGRNYGIGIMAVSQRPARIDLNFLGIVNHWIIFPQELKPDLDRLYSYLERTDKRFNPDFIATMPDRHFIHYWRDRESGRTMAVLCPPVKGNISTETHKNKA